MSDRVRAWLAMRAGPVPPALESRMESAIDETPGDGDAVHASLADAARTCLRAALTAADDRAAALHLLAADALLTYACEAAVDHDAAALTELVEAFAPERLAQLAERRGAG